MLYLNIIRFSFLRFFSYPFEILAETGKTIVAVAFLIFFWSLYAESATNSPTVTQFASYFLIASGINSLVMGQWGDYASVLKHTIQDGGLNNYLVKPISILPTLYCVAIGRNGMKIFFAVISIFIGIFINPPQTLVSILLFCIFFICAVFIAYAFNVAEGTLYLLSNDANGFRNSLNHIKGLLSGVMVPIYLFPSNLETIVKLSPFPWMVYGPTQGLKTNSLSPNIIQDVSVALFWAIMCNIGAYLFWKYSIKKYEAIGI